jgi:hypothetical protein
MTIEIEQFCLDLKLKKPLTKSNYMGQVYYSLLEMLLPSTIPI